MVRSDKHTDKVHPATTHRHTNSRGGDDEGVQYLLPLPLAPGPLLGPCPRRPAPVTFGVLSSNITPLVRGSLQGHNHACQLSQLILLYLPISLGRYYKEHTTTL